MLAYRGISTNLKELNVLADKLEDVQVVEQLLGPTSGPLEIKDTHRP